MAGVTLTPFHADEADHLASAQDYIPFFVLGRPESLRVQPPIAPDSPQHIRLLTGTLPDYLAGCLLWHSGRVRLEAWIPAWYYPQSVAENRAQGRWTPRPILTLGRAPSALLTAACLLPLYTLGRALGGPWAGMGSAFLFALHPLILLNGRRALLEGGLMFFCLATVALCLHYRTRGGRSLPPLLGLLAGCALACKLSALMALLPCALFFIHSGRAMRGGLVALGVAGLVYLALTPALWDAPLARFRLMLSLRAEVLRGQTSASLDAYPDAASRLGGLARLPFRAPPQFYEAPAFGEDAGLQAEIAAYRASPWAGFALPAVLGWALVALGVWGADPRLPHARLTLGLWTLSLGGLTAILTPLAWERYYLLWTCALTLWAGVGLATLPTFLACIRPAPRTHL
jgi:4-amino-4-deoxy-L-arabinose transferase-like glycosyltransferase